MRRLHRLKWFKFLIIMLIILGVFFRFANLNYKVYSADEVRKIYRIVGYTRQEIINKTFNGQIISAAEIQNYQGLNPEKSWHDTFKALSGNPEHPPLYFIINRLFFPIFNQPVITRLISILFSLLLFWPIFGLCYELFQSYLFGWISIGLLAVSPLQIHLAQNSSQYSLWMLTTALSSYLLLKALRLNNGSNWFLYSLTLIAGFYTHLYFITVFFTHITYTFIIERFKLSKKFVNFCLSSLISFVAFIPWIIVILRKTTKLQGNIGYYSQFNPSLETILMRFLRNVAHNFIDFHNTTRIENYLDYLIYSIIIYSLYILVTKSSKKTWIFIILLISVTPLIHILPNFVSPSARPLQARYYLPCYLGINLAVTYLIGSCLYQERFLKWQQIIGKSILTILISLGIISGIFITQIHDWGLDDQKGTANGRNIEMASIINQSKQPLVISEATHSFILGLSYLVDNKTQFILLQDQNVEQWEKIFNLAEKNNYFNQFTNIYVYNPDQIFLNFLENQKKLKLQKKTNGLSLIVK